jgi:hypothetical protein
MGMRVRVYTSNNESENHVLESFFLGCQIDDKVITDLDNYETSDLAVVFGTFKKQIPISYRRGNVVYKQKESGQRTVILETGYLNRGSGPNDYYAAGIDGINGRAQFYNKNSPPDRAQVFQDFMLPWRKNGHHILLCGQVPWDASVDHIDFVEWTVRTANILCGLTKRPIMYRPHPLGKTPAPPGTMLTRRQHLESDLKHCWAVVTFSSNSAVEATMAGIPVTADDEGSMVLAIANKISEIECPRKVNRQQWLNDLCYAQWTPQEMSIGMAWNHLFR